MWMRVRCGWSGAAALVWGLCLLSVAGHALCYPRAHTVYDIYADASRNWWAGEDIYARGREYYRYSPLLAITLTPFTMLPDNVGNALWKLFNALIYMTGLSARARLSVPQRLRRPPSPRPTVCPAPAAPASPSIRPEQSPLGAAA